jgi:Protein of unknown function (DUF1549)/Protein of unknown function (DUF1553)
MRRIRALTLAVLGLAASTAMSAEPADVSIEQAIDRAIDAGLNKAGLKAAAPADDATLLRRLTLDLIGRIPTVAETAAYVADTDPAKKSKLVDRLMASGGFARHQAQEFATLMQNDQKPRKGGKTTALRDYLRAGIAENRPWDRIFRELMLPDQVEPQVSGAEEFLKSRLKDLNRLTIDVSTIFFGVNVSCAQCHDHPQVSDWTQDHFYGMKAFFVRTVENKGKLIERDQGVVKYIPNKGQEKVAPVMFLTGKKITVPGMTEEAPPKEKKRAPDRGKAAKTPAAARVSLRAKLVETALEPGQRDFFARAIVNRLWYRYFGRGLVMPLDQMHSANPASHPELLTWLARDLVEHGYDLRRLTRGLVLSAAYARSSRWEGESLPPENLFAVARVRGLTPMQMAVSLRLATLDSETLPLTPMEMEKRLETLERTSEKDAGLFPQPGEKFQVGVKEALLFANNVDLQRALLEVPGSLTARLKALPDLEKRADLAVRTVLSRAPRSEEIQALTDYMRRREGNPEAACQQVVWALLTSSEFRFNH